MLATKSRPEQIAQAIRQAGRHTPIMLNRRKLQVTEQTLYR